MRKQAALAALLMFGRVSVLHAEVSVPNAPICGAKQRMVQHYGLWLGGQEAGYQRLCSATKNSRTVWYAFTDRGRGPQLKTTIRIGAQAIPSYQHTEGQDYLSAKVDEAYALNHTRGIWHNGIENGSQAHADSAFYVSQHIVPEQLAELVRAALAQPSQQLRLLPQGQARAVLVHEETLGANTLQLYALYGLDFSPILLWLDARHELFAQLDASSVLIPKAYFSAATHLLAIQNAWAAQQRKILAATLRRVPKTAVAIEHARVFDAQAMTVREDYTVLFEKGRIRALAPSATMAMPENVERIDAQGQTLLPGLWDMHSHPSLDDGLLYLANGVTGIRNMAAEPDTPIVMHAFETGEALGPTQSYAGIIDGKGPFHGPTRMLVDSTSEAVAMVNEIADAGLPMIKIYSSVKPELVPILAQAAHRRGLRVGGHVPAFMRAEQAILAGYDEIQHINMLALNFLYASVQDTRGPARFTAVAEHAADLDLQSKPVMDFVQLMKDRHTVSDPTLVTFEHLFTDRPGQVNRAYQYIAQRMPPLVSRRVHEGGLPVPEGQAQTYQASFNALQAWVYMLWKNGVQLVAGTDAMAGFSLARELELYTESGIPNLDVLRIATLDAARIAGQGANLGSIEPGKIADFILVDGKPDQHMQDIRRVRFVIKHGAFIDLAALNAQLGIQPVLKD